MRLRCDVDVLPRPPGVLHGAAQRTGGCAGARPAVLGPLGQAARHHGLDTGRQVRGAAAEVRHGGVAVRLADVVHGRAGVRGLPARQWKSTQPKAYTSEAGVASSQRVCSGDM